MDETTEEEPKSGSRPLLRAKGAARANIATGIGSVWTVFGAPGSVLLTLFLKEWLHAEKWQIGLVVTMTCLGTIFEPPGAYLVERFGRRKLLFVGSYLLNRIPFFLLAFVPWCTLHESARASGIWLVLAVIAFSRVCAHLGTPAWWSWIADLIPDRRKSRFFGCRFQVSSAVTAASLLLGMLMLDGMGGMSNIHLTSALFAIGASCGVLDILLYLWVPEPRMARSMSYSGTWRAFAARFCEPFKEPVYRRLLLGMGIWSFSSNLALPFLPIYQRGEWLAGQQIGLGISWLQLAGLHVIGHLAATFTSRIWARWVELIGPQRLLAVSAGHLLLNAVYLLVGPGFPTPILYPLACFGGALNAGWIVSTQQLMLRVSPKQNRSFYVSAYNVTNGCMMAWGPLLGGILADCLPLLGWKLPGGAVGCYFHLLVLMSVIGSMAGLAVLVRIPTTSTKKAVRMPTVRPPWIRRGRSLDRKKDWITA